MDEQRIYVIVAAVVTSSSRKVVQPAGRQIAQACHAVSKLRHSRGPVFDFKTISELARDDFQPVTTIVLQARDQSELCHVNSLLNKKKLQPVTFHDTNEQAYGPGEVATAVAVYATKKQIELILDYLPLWGLN